ncbi:MAG: glycosyltransferase family 4 protein [Myxococcales bacterium]|nr:glycosyltransferase family 4 protein [Myxococcota bacterium]MDW8283313.1 glycosyltransferase family 4 protein [Myxococcales bacterium]
MRMPTVPSASKAVDVAGEKPPSLTAPLAPRLRILFVSKIFPNRNKPGWAPFNRQQLVALSRLPGVTVVDVLATVPYFPGAGLFRGRSLAADLLNLPARDTIDGLPVRHPRTLYLPRLGHAVSPLLYAASLLPVVPRYRGRVDVLLAAWAYPDGCAAVMLGRLLDLPVVVKLHGSDINVLGQRTGPRQLMQLLLPRASRVVAVSDALRDRAAELGVAPERIDVVRNGVDAALFRPLDQAEARRQLGLASRPTVVCVSRLERAKGVLDLLEAFALLRRQRPDVQLLLVGSGEAEHACSERSAAEDLRGSVVLAGAVPLEQVPLYMGAADVVVMPSWAEGLPNTVLEAQACGRPVVATDVGGVSEVVNRPELGVLVPPRQPAALAAALAATLARPFDPARIAGARSRSWQDSAEGLLQSLRRAVQEK